ncbi:MAG: hypothetical protein JWM27_3586 [Gemmatimonadetes bacterium]|nr:hypothetical protein [Gemmatimonadota bacterium]
MFGSTMLDVGIGLILVYLLMSVVASAVREGVEAWLKTRAVDLERGIRELLHDTSGTGLTVALYSHPLISSLYHGTYNPLHIKDNGHMPGRTRLPSYIPASNFALALLDVAARGRDPTDVHAAGPNSPALTLDSVRSNIHNIENPAVQRALLAAVDAAQGDLQRAQKNVEAWFNGSMDRVSGWYKRRTQRAVLLIGLTITVALNVNTISIANALLRDPALRARVVKQAEKVAGDSAYAGSAAAGQADSTTFRQKVGAIEALGLPIGWSDGYRGPMVGRSGNEAWDDVTPIIGWLLTAFAVSLGAPFWFDVLNRVMVIRSTVKPHEKSPEEGSQDHRSSNQAPPPSMSGPTPQAPVVVAPSPVPPGSGPAGGPSTPDGGEGGGAAGGGVPGAPGAAPAAESAAASPAAPAPAVQPFVANQWAGGDPQEGVL